MSLYISFSLFYLAFFFFVCLFDSLFVCLLTTFAWLLVPQLHMCVCCLPHLYVGYAHVYLQLFIIVCFMIQLFFVCFLSLSISLPNRLFTDLTIFCLSCQLICLSSRWLLLVTNNVSSSFLLKTLFHLLLLLSAKLLFFHRGKENVSKREWKNVCKKRRMKVAPKRKK